MKPIPKKARVLLFYSALLIATPSLMSLYHGNAGKFLVATGALRDPVFGGTVIYLNRHDLWGSHGILINKPLDKNDFANPPPEFSWKVKLYNGGPVDYGRSNYLLVPMDSAPNGLWVVDIPTLRKFRPDFTAKLDRHQNKADYRLFSGYAGWRPLQLNIEMLRGGWAVIDYDPDLMFHTPPEEVWKKAIAKSLKDRPAAIDGT